MERDLAFSFNVATVAMGLTMSLLRPKGGDVLAAELVRNAKDIEAVYGSGAARAEFAHTLKVNTLADFAFILCYGGAFFTLGLLAGGAYGIVVCVLAWCAAMADVAENVGILRTIAGEASDEVARATRTPALIKWGLLGVVCLLLSPLFLAHGIGGGWGMARAVTGVSYAVAGVHLLWGLRQHGVIKWGVSLMSLALLVQMAVLWGNAGAIGFE